MRRVDNIIEKASKSRKEERRVKKRKVEKSREEKPQVHRNQYRERGITHDLS